MKDLETRLHPSLIRPILLAGAERELVLINLIVIAVLILGVGPHPLTLLLAAFLGTAGHTLMVWAARYDPHMWRVYARHMIYQPFYPARARFDVAHAPIHVFNSRPK